MSDVAHEALDYIQNYDGEKAITLPTGEKAIDNDDAYVIIGDEEVGEPYLRDKREQRIREVYKKEGKEFPDEANSDVYLLDAWDYFPVCEFADKLLGI
jgi:hypothetical protein